MIYNLYDFKTKLVKAKNERARDIIVDVNKNGYYDEGIDALDNNDLEVAAGFVIPEFPLTALFSVLAMTTFLAVVAVRKKTSFI